MVAPSSVHHTPAPHPPVLTPTAAPQRQPFSRLEVLRSYMVIVGLGALVLTYLALACRVLVLEDQLVTMEKRLSEARFQALQGKRELVASLSLETLEGGGARLVYGRGIGGPETPLAGDPLPPVRCPALPPLERSALSEVAGRLAVAPEEPEQSPRH